MSTETLPEARRAGGSGAHATKTPDDLGLPGKPVVAGPKDTPAAHLRAKLDAQLRALLVAEPGTRSGVDPEDLHQMRVAVRRMRSVLKLAGSTAAQHARAELKWLGAALGEVRDYDVLIAHLRATVATFDEQDRPAADRFVAIFSAERTKARRRLNRKLNTVRYSSILAEVAQLSRAAEIETADGAVRLDPVRAVRRPYRRLAKAVSALADDPPDGDLHALRIYGKRLRYAAELAIPAAKKKQAPTLRSLVKAARKLQDVLGEHQDAVVAADRSRALALASRDPGVSLVAGRVVEREVTRRAEARAAWPGAIATIDTLAARLGL
ncbi:MAG TPA: CHAD domain-containing protein [Amycolatopsis sp.]|nr:CHAD domain-containing protein [Amycolatopsis sp.]